MTDDPKERRGMDHARTMVMLFGIAVTLIGGGMSVGVIINKLDTVTSIVPVVQDINVRLTRVEERTRDIPRNDSRDSQR